MNQPEKQTYRVLIVGAGPAGLACALYLKRLGVDDVLVLERATFPRDKCCAGYVTEKTARTYRALGLDLNDCHYSFIEDFRIFRRGVWRQRIVNRFLYTNRRIDRVELDDAFFRAAKRQGVSVLEDAQLVSHDPDAHTVTVKDGTTLGYNALVFADGTKGFSSRYQKRGRLNLAMQLLTPTDRPDGIELHFGVSRAGYGWISTCRGRTNIGLTDAYCPETNYRELFEDFLRRNGIEADTTAMRGAFTPIGVRRAVLPGGLYYVGDALGACDPLTLSGLRYGLKSGQMAAHAIATGRDAILTRYAARLRVRFCMMRAMQRVFYLRPVQFLVFDVGCRFFGGLIAFVFNHFFVNKK